MLNLAGRSPVLVWHRVRKELETAGIPIQPRDMSDPGEVRSPILGVVDFTDGQHVEFQRLWVYYSVNCTTPFPQKAAEKLNHGWHYNEVRVDGFGGGTSVDADVTNYHVDTVRGLAALMEALVKQHGPVCGPVSMVTASPPFIDQKVVKRLPVRLALEGSYKYVNMDNIYRLSVITKDGTLRVPYGPDDVLALGRDVIDTIQYRGRDPIRFSEPQILDVCYHVRTNRCEENVLVYDDCSLDGLYHNYKQKEWAKFNLQKLLDGEISNVEKFLARITNPLT